MRRESVIGLCLVLGGFLSFLSAQGTSGRVSQDSIPQKRQREVKANSDTVAPFIAEKKIVLQDSVIFNKPEFKPDSKKAVIYSAIFPGLGQLYNRKYWKLPIIYGGAIGLTYAITWNGRVYNDYNKAYRDLMVGPGDSYKDFLGVDTDVYARKEYYASLLKRRKDFYRRNRDLAIIVAVGVYALCMIDAYVDAQLYDFDMSTDLSMRVVPIILGPTSYSKTSFGLQCSINF